MVDLRCVLISSYSMSTSRSISSSIYTSSFVFILPQTHSLSFYFHPNILTVALARVCICCFFFTVVLSSHFREYFVGFVIWNEIHTTTPFNWLGISICIRIFRILFSVNRVDHVSTNNATNSLIQLHTSLCTLADGRELPERKMWKKEVKSLILDWKTGNGRNQTQVYTIRNAIALDIQNRTRLSGLHSV